MSPSGPHRNIRATLGHIDPYFAVGFGSVLVLAVAFAFGSAVRARPSRPVRVPQAVFAALRTNMIGPVLGSRTSSVHVVEIADYQCTACATAHRETWPVLRRHAQAGTITYEVRQVALPGHVNAVPAAVTAACVAAVSPHRFWSYHARLYATQDQWAGRFAPQATLLRMAAETGSDSAGVRACVERHGDAVAAAVQNGFRVASAAGFPYTPVWAVNGKVVLWRNLDNEINSALRMADAARSPRTRASR